MILLAKNDLIIILPILIVVIGAVIFLSHYFSIKQVVLRKLSKIPFKSTGGIKTNELAKVSGKALHVKVPLIAPLSGRKCVFYTIKIEKRVSTGKSSHWKTVIDEEKTQEFFIENRGDYVIVRPTQSPKNYKSYLVKDVKTSSGAFNDPTPEFESLLKQYNIDPVSFLGFNKSLRYKEGVIEIGEKITVAGIAKWKTLSESIPEYPYSKIAELVSTEKDKLLITDLPIENKRKDRF
ncbi:GIDE domain-containing protein [Pontimicrobium aquaticum]|uniref:Uncharacterized protein n=1 Tax=Pontimicrobium aquaticum TaxID=2565367 RepID=A0A4U0F022_9FLAO|nr:GIDE domain-containing protein [Pontimicrobium aquaticum]TJY37707.1 hypothetical protein E5167_00180 [Pontimicrobium aquaticum]